MAADITQAVQVVTLDGSFGAFPTIVTGITGFSVAVVDMKGMETGGDSGGGSGGSTRPTSGMLYPRGQG